MNPAQPWRGGTGGSLFRGRDEAGLVDAVQLRDMPLIPMRTAARAHHRMARFTSPAAEPQAVLPAAFVRQPLGF